MIKVGSRDRNRILSLLIFSCVIMVSAGLRGQEFSRLEPEQFDPDVNYGWFNFVHLNYFKGDHLTYPRELTEFFTRGYDAVELRLGWQSTGRQMWQQLHNFPSYGLGTFIGRMGESDIDSILGTPSGIYFFYGEPWARFGRFTFITDLALGLSYDFVPYDREDNPTNDVIGSRVNLYFNLNAFFLFKASHDLDLTLGYNLIHFSNGRTNTPQRGINLGGLNIGARYHFNPVIHYTRSVRPGYIPSVRPEFIRDPRPDYRGYGEIQFTVSGGTVLTEPGELKDSEGIPDSTGLQGRYFTSTVALEYDYLVARKVKLHAGLDGFYDGSLENFIRNTPPGEVDLGGKVMLGVSGGIQYLIERFAFYFGTGFYAYKQTHTRGKWYMRAGGRIGLTDDLDIHMALKTRNGGIADWIEWGLAYKLRVHD